MTKRLPWDKFEVALLIDTYLQVVENKLAKNDAIINLSNILHQKAINSGLEIDNVHRNTNDVAMRFTNIQYLFTDDTTGLSSHSSLDKYMYELY